ncbi:hypothetical protein GZ77_21420 [Endozoicomonas montiporae]|uniref:Uncharacterized protein n=2 Tax=Endozoicomonas montiporae TaxID=1027273 RepID=A0A081N3G1_9GAMM|nr:hypothetical protein [Endozoicomonas montiporae]AMO58291.1 hypothetical protein EZMO1_4375 [Endozoicomonas montiporae CL-33]KEQ12984.1 hypothetical protein GZ77_21420 [Endozoicomonas montiporae]
MSLEARVTKLERKVEQLDHAFHENNKTLEATHGVVSLILNEQREKFRKLEEDIQTTRNANNKRFNKIEELLIQIVNHLASK